MKRKLKITGLALLIVSVLSVFLNGATSGSVGFGFFVLVCFFAAMFALIGMFVLSLMQYRILKKYVASKTQIVNNLEKKCQLRYEESEEKNGE